MRARLFVTLVTALLMSCASKPVLKAEGARTDVAPPDAVARNLPSGTRVLWGGVIVATTNLKDATQMEILAYPLEEDQKPETDKSPLGRFLVIQPGYLESADYAAGRSVTLVGTLSGIQQGKIGETEYTYPMVNAERIHLWRREEVDWEPASRMHFGVGVGVILP